MMYKNKEITVFTTMDGKLFQIYEEEKMIY